MSPERKAVMQELRRYFGNNLAGRIKALQWYNTNNPLLGGVSPKHMVQAGRGDNLIKMIRVWIDEGAGKPE